MIDIETLGTRPGDVILEIGAACFNHKFNIIDQFEAQLDIVLQTNAGFKEQESTRLWWDKQGGLPVKYTVENEHWSPVMMRFRHWIWRNSNIHSRFWSKGSMDMNMLAFHFSKSEVELPWQYWQQRDLRTLLELLTGHTNTRPTHSALQDCTSQLEAMKKAIHFAEGVYYLTNETTHTGCS